MYGFRGMGQADLPPMGPTPLDQPDTFSASDLASLVPAAGPDASAVAPLQVGALAQQVSSSGQYSVNPSTGQLETNVIAGVSNSSLLLWVGLGFGGVLLLGAFAGGRRR